LFNFMVQKLLTLLVFLMLIGPKLTLMYTLVRLLPKIKTSLKDIDLVDIVSILLIHSVVLVLLVL
jgi:hypothetical protein